MLFAEFGTGQVFWSMLWFFLFFIWIWILIAVFGDIFRSGDLSGWGKAIWSIFVIFLPLLGVLVYLGANGKGMAERNVQQAQAAQAQSEQYIRSVATGGGGTASEIAQAKQLLDSGAIDANEFEALKRKALAAGTA